MKIKRFLIFFLPLVLFAYLLLSFSNNHIDYDISNIPVAQPYDNTPQPSPKFCGGIAGLPCPSGFDCKLDGSYPDAGGTCIETSTKIYQCPQNGWVDCMPGPEIKPDCTPEALDWFKQNCPNFQGAAL